MSNSRRGRLAVLFAGLLLGSAGCQPATDHDANPGTPEPKPADADDAAAAAPASTSAPASAAATSVLSAADARLGYRCDNGDIIVARYVDHAVVLRWPDGRSETLPRAESASRGGGDVYVGARVSLQRERDRIELHDGDAPPVVCIASHA